MSDHFNLVSKSVAVFCYADTYPQLQYRTQCAVAKFCSVLFCSGLDWTELN